jgi:ribosomal protein L31E
MAEEEKKTSIKEEIKKKVEESKSAVEKSGESKTKKETKKELEREYIVPLKKGSLNVPRYKRAKKAVKTLKEFIAQHMQIRDRDLRKVKLDINLNNELWFRGIKKPYNKIKVKAKKVGDIVYVELAEIPKTVGYKIKKQEKMKAASIKASPKEQPKPEEKEDGVAEETKEKEDEKSTAIVDAKVTKEATKAQKHTTQGSHKNVKPQIKQPTKN